MPRPTDVMLASPPTQYGDTPEQVIRNLENRGGWLFEIKWDGVRAVVTLDHGHVHITNRRDSVITWRYPDLVAPLAGVDVARTVLDCEIVVLRDGRPDFPAIHRRDAQGSQAAAQRLARTLPATLVPFDLLERDGVSTELLPYLQRREQLQDVVAALALPADRLLLPPISPSGQALWSVVTAQGLEGLVAKRAGSTYRRVRSPEWIKIKANIRISVLVSGYSPSAEHPDTFGNLHIKLLDGDGQLVPAGHVGAGFTDADRRRLTTLMRNHVLPIVIEVECLGATPSGSLRFPVYKGTRDDVDALSCTTDQLTGGTP